MRKIAGLRVGHCYHIVVRNKLQIKSSKVGGLFLGVYVQKLATDKTVMRSQPDQ